MRASGRRSAAAARRAGAGALLLVGLALGGSLLVALALGQPAASAGVDGSTCEEPAASQQLDEGPASEEASPGAATDAEQAAADLDAEIDASGAVQAGAPDDRGGAPDARLVVPQLATMIPPQAPPGRGEEGEAPPGDDPEAGDGVSGVEGFAAGVVQAPVPASPVRLTAANLGTVEDLHDLVERWVPPEQFETWGTGWAKTVHALHYEIGVGEGVIAVAAGSDGAETLLREVHAVAAEVRHAAADGQVWRNYESRQQPDGSFEPRLRFGPIDVRASTLYGKMQAGASPEATILRELEEEAGVLPANVRLTPLGTAAGWTDSPSYPGLPTHSTYHLFVADVDEVGFAGGAARLEHHPDGTPPSLFTWQTRPPVEGDRRSAADAPAPDAAFQLLPGPLPPGAGRAQRRRGTAARSRVGPAAPGRRPRVRARRAGRAGGPADGWAADAAPGGAARRGPARRRRPGCALPGGRAWAERRGAEQVGHGARLGGRRRRHLRAAALHGRDRVDLLARIRLHAVQQGLRTPRRPGFEHPGRWRTRRAFRPRSSP